MNCLPCCNNDDDDDEEASDPQTSKDNNGADIDAAKEAAASNSKAKTFNFRELAMATKNFRQECLLGEGGFGRVFKGKLQTGQVVAVKQLDRNGMQGHKEFLVEVLMLSLIQHPNLVSLIGYCADGDQRLLVYEYLSMGSLENQLFGDDPDKKPMDWVTRMKIASGAANGLEYLHEKANPPIIYRDLKPSNILLDESFEPKLSDFGLAKLGAGAGKVNPTSRVMGTYGYSAPEYSSGGELTLKSDIYSFGVVLLELITGRKAVDTTRPNDEQNLVTWAQPIFREPKRFPELADPRLNNEFPVTSLNQVVGICAMCLQEEPCVRPLIGDVVAALSFLAMPQPMPSPAPAPPPENTHAPPSEQKMHYDIETNQPDKADNDRSSEDSDSSESENLSASNKSHDESSQISGDRDISTQSSARESERQDSDRRQSFDNNSDERSTYSDSDSEGEDTSYDDPETIEIEDPGTSRSETSSANYSLYSAQSTDSSLKSDRGNKSSKHGSSKRSSPTPRARSHRRKPVVTFKEPSLSAKKNGTRKPDEKNLSSQSSNQRVSDSNATESRQKSSSSSSSSSDSSSEFEIEEGSSRNMEDTKISLKEENYEEDTDSTERIDETHRDFDQSHEDVPKL